MVPILQEIVDYLNREKVRATYGAVGEAIGVPARSIGAMLGGRRPEVSWVVSSATELPTGYVPSQYHPDLRSRSRVIRDGNELREAVGLRKR